MTKLNFQLYRNPHTSNEHHHFKSDEVPHSVSSSLSSIIESLSRYLITIILVCKKFEWVYAPHIFFFLCVENFRYLSCSELLFNSFFPAILRRVHDGWLESAGDDDDDDDEKAISFSPSSSNSHAQPQTHTQHHTLFLLYAIYSNQIVTFPFFGSKRSVV